MLAYTHLGIKRGITTNRTGDENVNQNINKARRTAYSLFASGLHGQNGLDPQTTIHLIRIYIIPVLLYGLEIVLLNKSQVDRLELYQKKLLKYVLSVSVNTPDAAVYILTGILPIEAQIHKKTLIFFNNVCRQSDDSIEKRLAIRQTLKSKADHKKLLVCCAPTYPPKTGPTQKNLLPFRIFFFFCNFFSNFVNKKYF